MGNQRQRRPRKNDGDIQSAGGDEYHTGPPDPALDEERRRHGAREGVRGEEVCLRSRGARDQDVVLLLLNAASGGDTGTWCRVSEDGGGGGGAEEAEEGAVRESGGKEKGAGDVGQ
jgi:hypothetical protein